MWKPGRSLPLAAPDPLTKFGRIFVRIYALLFLTSQIHRFTFHSLHNAIRWRGHSYVLFVSTFYHLFFPNFNSSLNFYFLSSSSAISFKHLSRHALFHLVDNTENLTKRENQFSIKPITHTASSLLSIFYKCFQHG